MVDARKVRIDASSAWCLLKNVAKITVVKGEKCTELNPQQDSKEDILRQVLGPSGNLRAPTCWVGDGFVIGFNADLYDKFFKTK